MEHLPFGPPHLEQEIKLTAIGSETLAKLRDSDLIQQHLVADSYRPARPFKARYYDTDQLELGALRWSLRARLEGDHWVAALKTGGSIVNGLAQCHEYEAPIDGPFDRIDSLPDSFLKDVLLTELEANTALQIRVETNIQRTQMDLAIDDVVIELVTDEGSISANGMTLDHFEAEMELREGNLHHIQPFVDQLIADFDLIPSQLNKHSRGLSLYDI